MSTKPKQKAPKGSNAIGTEVWVVSDVVAGARLGRVCEVHTFARNSESYTVQLPGRAPVRVWELFTTAEEALLAKARELQVQMDLIKHHLKNCV